MKTPIEIVRVDEENQKAFIIGLKDDLVIVENITLGITQKIDLQDLFQFVKFLRKDE